MNWDSAMPHFTCPLCGISRRCRTKSRQRIFCSNSCRSTWWMSHNKKAGTNIEIIMADALRQRDIDFQEQVRFGHFIADFVLPEVHIALCCDGDFWHTCYENGDRDKRQSEMLRAAGLDVHRFLGSEILKDVNGCLDRISVLPAAMRTNLGVAE